MSDANSDGRTPLHMACSMGHLDTVKLLVSRGASVHVKDNFHHTPLHNAVYFKLATFFSGCEASFFTITHTNMHAHTYTHTQEDKCYRVSCGE